MQVIADLHIHSKYARAVSQDMVVPEIARWASKKGIDLVATGDWTHPLWFRELQANLEEAGKGVYRLRTTDYGKTAVDSRRSTVDKKEPLFLLSTEVSCIYSQGGKGRRIHILIFAPSFETVEKINREFVRRNANLLSDGRPIMGLSSKDVAELVLSLDPTCLLVPAHAWTPWFSLYGSMSGFDSIEECFGEFSKYIYAIETGLSCYDTETEVLTEKGWKLVSTVTYADKICTLNVDTEEIEYQRPQKVYQYRYQGKMYRLKTKRADLLVTPNHNLLYAPADFHTRRPYRLKEAQDLFGKSKILRKDGVWKGKMLRYFILPEVKIRHGSRFYSGFRNKTAKKFPIEPWLKFFGFWIAEGWTSEGENGHYAVCISNQNHKLMTEMKHILESFGYTVFWDKKTTNTIRVRDYQLFHYLQQFGKASDKYIPIEVKKLSKEFLERFFEFYIKGDGHVYGRNGKGLSATTISTRLRDDLQEIALKIGISAYYKLHNKKGTPFSSSREKEYKQSADSWNIYFIRQNRHAIIPSAMKKYKYEERWIDYEGMVYCVSVPNRAVYIRRNGIPLWCGNSDPAMNWRIAELEKRNIVSFSDAHSPAKLGREATVFEVEQLSYEAIYKAIVGFTDYRLRTTAVDGGPSTVDSQPSVAYTIEFYPEEGKYHYTGHRNCNVRQSPEETRKRGTTCHVCRKPLTVGVMHRVEQLASQKIPNNKFQITNDDNGVRWIKHPEEKRPPYIMMVPLIEILAEALSSGTSSKKVVSEYEKLTNTLGPEFKILLQTKPEEIERLSGSKVREAIMKVRSGDIFVDPGYDGVFGKVKIWPDDKEKDEIPKVPQNQLDLF